MRPHLARKYHVLYPDDIWLTQDDIERRFRDAVAANELCTDYLDARTPDDMADALHEAGFIRLAGDAPKEEATTDIVERLCSFWPDGPGHQIAWGAATEIKRLRAALQNVVKYWDMQDPNRGAAFETAIKQARRALEGK